MSPGMLAGASFSIRPRWATPLSVAVLAGGFVAAAACEATGVFSGIDQYAAMHLMPELQPGPQRLHSLWRGLYSPFVGHTPGWAIALKLWVYPCSVLVSGLIIAAVWTVMARRGYMRAGVVLAACWVVGNLVELIGKGLLHRPELYTVLDGVRYHLAAFDGSFPSGHMIRGVIVVYGAWIAWPHVVRGAVAWFLPVAPMLVATASHTPSDVLGGALVGLALVGASGRVAERSQAGRRAGDPR